MTYDAAWAADDDPTGLRLRNISNAIQAWSWLQGRETTLGEAATVFNLTPERVIEAISDHPWMYLAGDPARPVFQTIEHEGD